MLAECSPQDEGEVLRRVGGNERHVGRYGMVSLDGDEKRKGGKAREGSTHTLNQTPDQPHSPACSGTLRRCCLVFSPACHRQQLAFFEGWPRELPPARDHPRCACSQLCPLQPYSYSRLHPGCVLSLAHNFEPMALRARQCFEAWEVLFLRGSEANYRFPKFIPR